MVLVLSAVFICNGFGCNECSAKITSILFSREPGGSQNHVLKLCGSIHAMNLYVHKNKNNAFSLALFRSKFPNQPSKHNFLQSKKEETFNEVEGPSAKSLNIKKTFSSSLL